MHTKDRLTIVLEDTQYFTALRESDDAMIECHYTRANAENAAAKYFKQFNEPCRIGTSWINDRPQTIGEREANDKSNKEHLEWS